MQALPPALAPLARYRQFIAYRLTPSTKQPGKMDKKPVRVSDGWTADPTDPTSWADARTVLDFVAQGRADGVGFVFTEHDPFFFLDIDHCLDNGQWSPLAQSLLNATAGAAVEVSQSGTGLHIIGTGTAPAHSCRNKAHGLEFYTEGRFVALTGNQASGDASTDCTPVLAPLVDAYFPPGADGPDSEGWTTEPVPEWRGYESDNDLIEAALYSATRNTARDAFGNGESRGANFAALWYADEAELAKHYPDPGSQGRAYGESEADAALAQHLAFWTGKNCERVFTLMWSSALVRDKWEAREDYLRTTIERACSRQEKVHQRKEQPEPTQPSAPMGGTEGPELLAGQQFLSGPQQLEHFTGCVYVRDLHRVWIPEGALLKSDQFKATYGGYTFTLDPEGVKTTRNAWEAFTESQAVRYPKVNKTMFRPDLPPGERFTFNGVPMLNSYVPIDTPRQAGDPSPFLRHLEKLLPSQRDRDILLAYMAACVQHKGVKFQWWPLLQGVQGNGKTLLSRCVAEAVGMAHVHSPRAEEISNKFNSWIKDKIFIYVEDVYYPDHKREVIEALKPLVTNDWLAVEPKGVDQTTDYVCANGILNSNHRDAIKKTRDDRRFSVFFTAQQSPEDLVRDGMAGDYFPDLYRWLKNRGGYAVVADFLHTYAIPDALNPATECHRAPDTSTTDQAISESLGSVEQEIVEAIDQGRPGFAGGWVSSMALDRLLEQMRATRSVPPNKRRDMMIALGYDWHPALPNGRVNNMIPGDNGKPRLFIREGHIHRNLTSPAEVARHYSEAQSVGAAGGGSVDVSVNGS